MLIDNLGTHELTETEKALLPEVDAVGGHFSGVEILMMYRLVKLLGNSPRILEIGSYRGRSANAMAHALKGKKGEIYCLDIWRDFDKQPTGPLQNDPTAANLPPTDYAVFEDFLRNIEWFGEKVRVLRGSTKQFQHFLPERFFDLIFIDAAHDYENVAFDISVAKRCIKHGGVICGHDFHSMGHGVRQAVAELIVKNPDISEYEVIPGTFIWYGIYTK